MFKLVCIHPFGDYVKGQEVTDQKEIEMLMVDKEGHFSRVAVPVKPQADPVSEPKSK